MEPKPMKQVKNVFESKIFHISVSLLSLICLTVITVIIVESVSFVKNSVIQTYTNENNINTVMVLVKDNSGRLVCIEKTLKDIVPKIKKIDKKTYGIDE